MKSSQLFLRFQYFAFVGAYYQLSLLSLDSTGEKAEVTV